MAKRPSTNPDVARIEAAFERKRDELGIRDGFPPEVVAEAEAAAKRDPSADPDRVDLTEIPFVTIDPPGSRDLDQALRIERAGDGFRLWYAIADVGFFVDRGGAVEREAWLRGETFYAPDRKVPLYPPALSEGGASLLPDQRCPAVVFDFTLDARAEPVETRVERALVQSRAQLTYAQALEHVEGGGKRFAGEPWADTLTLLKEFGELRREREAERGGVSLPILSQHVQRTAAAKLGYVLEYEEPQASEDWNAQVSLLTGHEAAARMLRGGTGLLRLMPGPEEKAVETFRRAAKAMGVPWPEGMRYADFIRSLDPCHPCSPAVVWQARRVARGADYVAFHEAPPEDPLHHALAMEYAHATAPLRRLGDRYVLDLLVALEKGVRPPPEEGAMLRELAAVLNEAETRSGRLDRAVVDVAEAWTLQPKVGESFPATLLGVRGPRVEVQIEEPPVRAEAERGAHDEYLRVGQHVRVRLDGVSVEEGRLDFVLA